MKLAFNLCVVIIALVFSKCSSQSVSLIGSRFLSNNSTFKAYLLTHDLQDDSQVNVEIKSTKGHQMVLNDLDQSPFQELVFNTPLNDSSNYELSISTKLQNDCQKQSVDLVHTSDVPIVFIQFDKPIYRRNEIFKFKVFILSQKLLPISEVKSMTVSIENPVNKILWSHDNIQDVSDYGVYENSINLSDLPNYGQRNFGIWNIKVEVDERKVSKSFEVQNINKDDTELFIQIPSEVAFADRQIYLNIYTKEPQNLYAAIHLQAKFVNSSKVEIQKQVKRENLASPKTTVMMDFKDDFGITFPTKDMILKLTVTIFDRQNKPKATVEKDVIMRYKDRHTFQVLRKNYFKPGFKFPIKIKVKLLDGRPDNSFNQLSTTIKYISSSKNPKSNAEEKTYETNLKNGETVHILQPKAKTSKIIVNMKFADAEYTEEIESLPGVEEYLQILMLNKGLKVGSQAKLKAQSTEEMEQLHLMVFGTNGIVHSQTFEDAAGKDIFEFSMELTEEMRPEARGLVFYIRESDGKIIFDEFSINIGFSIDNSLEISAPDKAKPNEVINIEAKTEKDSQVFLVAIDANSDLYNMENGISRTSIYNEIAHHINRKFSNPSDYKFEKYNGFVLEPLKNGLNCKSSPQTNKNDKEVEEFSKIEPSSQKYFPEVLNEQNFIQKSEIQTVQLQLPDSTTKWKIYGISVHPTKGFTVSKTNPEISVTETVKNVQIEIESPSTVKENEIHKIRIIAKNLQPSNLNGIVTLYIEDGVLMGEQLEKKSWNNNCIKYFNGKLPLTYDVQFNPQNSVDTKYVNIKAKGEKPIKILAKLETIKGKSEATTETNVEPTENKSKSEIISSNLIELNQRNLEFRLQLPNNAKSVKTFVDVHGNLLGHALDGLEAMFGRNMTSDEEKILKFQTAIINYKFLESIGQSNSDKAKKAKYEINEGGKDAQNILKNTLKDRTRLWFSAFIIGALKDAEGLFIADQKLITDSLDFIVNQQVRKGFINPGSFIYYPDSDDRKDIGTGMREFIQNGLIISAFSKNSNQRYQATIVDSLNFLYPKMQYFKGDYVNAITAYTFALFNYKDHANVLLKKINYGYASPNAKNFKKHHSMYVEIISYLIITKILTNEDPQIEVKWLLTHRKLDGTFYSPYDTTLALKALYEYSKYRKSGKSLVVEFDGLPNMVGVDEVKKFGPFEDSNHEFAISTQGLGYAAVYQEFDDDEVVRNSISTLRHSMRKINNLGNLEITFDFKFAPYDRDLNINLLVIEVEIPKGYKAIFAKKNGQDAEFRDNESTAVFHLHNVKKNLDYRSTMTIKRDINELEYHKPLMIKLYDYYRPNTADIYYYDLLCTQN